MIKFFTLEQVIEIHDALLEEHGGLSGIRDMNLLSSAVSMPRITMFGENLHKSVFEMAAAYLFHIVQNHPFIDGNKRTGAFTALLFLELNNATVNFSDELFEEVVVHVAQGKVKKQQVALFFQYGKIEQPFYPTIFVGNYPGE